MCICVCVGIDYLTKSSFKLVFGTINSCNMVYIVRTIYLFIHTYTSMYLYAHTHINMYSVQYVYMFTYISMYI